METLPDSTDSTDNTSSTRSSSRRLPVREFNDGAMAEENESKSIELASIHETMHSISNFMEKPIQGSKDWINSNRQEYAKSAAKRTRTGFKQTTKKRLRVDAAASLLATLNERAYSKSLLRDANTINQRIVLPMALPWMHDTVPLKNIPVDIDEMQDVLAAGEGRNMPFNHIPSSVNKKERKSKHVLARTSASLRLVARRSSDPGIIGHASIIQYVDERKLRPRSKASALLFRLGTSLPGEIALLSFETAHRRKCTVQEHAKTIIRKKHWSVRINSTSSKSSILPSNLAGYLEARLPSEVQDGRFLSTKRANAIAKTLGTYDCRHGLPPTNPTGKNANRITVGRTRRMWTAKSPPDKPQRVFFTSLLTGERLDGGSQKRPRNVRLAIRLDGEYFSNENPSQSPPLSLTHSWGTRAKKRCMIDPSNYVSILLKHGNPRQNGSTLCQEGSEDDGESDFREPQFECLPDNTGIICVTCTSPGNMTIPSFHATLNRAARRNSLHCTVCWATGSSRLGEVMVCSACGLLAHSQCCFDPGEASHVENGGTVFSKWKCAVCCSRRQEYSNDSSVSESIHHENHGDVLPSGLMKLHGVPAQLPKAPPKFLAGAVHQSSSRYDQKCALCPYSGGAMSPVTIDGTTHWIHEICRIWTDATMISESQEHSVICKTAICALCGVDEKTPYNQYLFKTENKLVKCAASKCRVYFHPMCSLVASKLQIHASPPSDINCETSGDSDLQEQIVRDRATAKQFTLSTMHCEVQEAMYGQCDDLPNQIPVCFCSIHNPSRDATLYGLYPGGADTDQSVVLVPSIARV